MAIAFSNSSAAALTHSILPQQALAVSSSYLTRALHFTTRTSRSTGIVRFSPGNVARVLKSDRRKSGRGRLTVVQAMRDSKATEITGDSWEELVLNNSAPVLVEFHASWCGPCKMVHRVVDEIAQEYAGKLKCFILNTDTDLHIAKDYDIKAVPVVVLFKNGMKHQAVFGTMLKEYYVDAIENLLQS